MKKIIVSFVALFLTMLYSASPQRDDSSAHSSTMNLSKAQKSVIKE